MTEKDARRIEDKLYRDAHRDEINARRRAWMVWIGEMTRAMKPYNGVDFVYSPEENKVVYRPHI